MTSILQSINHIDSQLNFYHSQTTKQSKQILLNYQINQSLKFDFLQSMNYHTAFKISDPQLNALLIQANKYKDKLIQDLFNFIQSSLNLNLPDNLTISNNTITIQQLLIELLIIQFKETKESEINKLHTSLQQKQSQTELLAGKLEYLVSQKSGRQGIQKDFDELFEEFKMIKNALEEKQKDNENLIKMNKELKTEIQVIKDQREFDELQEENEKQQELINDLNTSLSKYNDKIVDLTKYFERTFNEFIDSNPTSSVLDNLDRVVHQIVMKNLNLSNSICIQLEEVIQQLRHIIINQQNSQQLNEKLDILKENIRFHQGFGGFDKLNSQKKAQFERDLLMQTDNIKQTFHQQQIEKFETNLKFKDDLIRELNQQIDEMSNKMNQIIEKKSHSLNMIASKLILIENEIGLKNKEDSLIKKIQEIRHSCEHDYNNDVNFEEIVNQFEFHTKQQHHNYQQELNKQQQANICHLQKIQELNRFNDELLQQNEALNRELMNFKQIVTKQELEITNIQSISEQKNDLESIIQQYSQKISILQMEIITSNHQIETLNENLNNEIHHSQSFQSALQQAKNEIRQLKNHIQTQEGQLIIKDEQKQELQVEIQAFEQQSRNQAEIIKVLKQKEVETKKSQIEFKQLQRELEILKEECGWNDMKEREIHFARQKQEEIERLINEITYKSKVIEELKDKVEEQGSEIEVLNKIVDELRLEEYLELQKKQREQKEMFQREIFLLQSEIKNLKSLINQ